MGRTETAWPLVPMPFAGEALGGWFGRIAARYRMNVDELARAGGLNFDFSDDCCDWLAIPRLTLADRSRLAFLTGVHEEVLPEPYTGPGTRVTKSRFSFCEKCLWLNPLDVTTPFWKAEWADAVEERCPIHRTEFDYIIGQELSKCKNMRRLLTCIEKRSRKKRRVERFPWLR